MAFIRKLKGNRAKPHQVTWRNASNKQTTRAFRTRREAERFRVEVESQLARGIQPSSRFDGGREESATLSAICAEYIRESTLTQAKNTATQKAQTLNILLRFVGDDPASLNRTLLLDWYEDLATDGLHGGTRTAGTRKKMIQRAIHMWRWAAEHDQFAGLVGPPVRIPLTGDPRRPAVAPSWAEMDACINSCIAGGGRRRPNPGLHQLAVLLRFTGLRVGQAMELRFSDLNFDTGILTIDGRLGKTQQEKAGRRIPVSLHLIEELSKWGRREGYIVDWRRKSREPRQRDMRRAWVAAGVREEACEQSHHAFRKGFISELIRAGVPEATVKRLVGHSGGLTSDVYTDPDALGMREAVAKIPALNKVILLGARDKSADQSLIRNGAKDGKAND